MIVDYIKEQTSWNFIWKSGCSPLLNQEKQLEEKFVGLYLTLQIQLFSEAGHLIIEK